MPSHPLPSIFTKASDLEHMAFPDLLFIVDQLLPVGLSMIIAKPKMGKSFFALDLAVAVANGETFLDLDTVQGDVVYFALEDNLRRLQQRTLQLMNGEDFPEDLDFAVEAKRINEGLQEQIESWRVAVSNPKLVIIDTYGRVMPSGKNADSYSQVSQDLGKLQKYAFENNITILLVHHTRKNSGDITDPFENALGSQAILGVMDATLSLDRSRFGGEAQLSITGRDLEERVLSIKFDKTRGLWQASKADMTSVLGVTPDRLKVLEAIADGNTKSGDIAKALGLSQSNAGNMLKALLEDGHISKPKTGEYELSENVKDLFSNTSMTSAESSSADLSVSQSEMNESSESLDSTTDITGYLPIDNKPEEVFDIELIFE